MEPQPQPHSPEAADAPAPAPGGDRRLYRRYPAGLGGELLVGGRALPCRVTDISLGGTCVELRADDGLVAIGAGPGAGAELRAPEIAGGRRFAVEIKRLAEGGRLHLAFPPDDAADFELTMFLVNSPATLDGTAA